MTSSGAPPKKLSDLDTEVVTFSNASVLLAQTLPFFCVALAVVIERCYVRIVMLRAFGGDDWTIVLAMGFAIACFVCYMIEISCGVGKHVAVIQANAADYRTLLKARQLHQITVMTGISMVKISVSLLLLRLATRKTYSWFLWTMIGFMVAFTLACMGTLVVNITTDFVLALVPIPLIWKLQLNLRSRISLVAVLSLGIFASIAGIIKQTNASQFRDPEPYIKDGYSIWNFLELYIGIIAASLPALKPVFSRFYDTALGMTRQSKGTGIGSGPVQGGYQKQTGSNDIVLKEYKTGPSVRISAHPSEGWVKGREMGTAKGSEDSILSHTEREDVTNSIIVTRQVRIS